MCFTMISTFNLIPSATGTTGWNGHKTRRFYPLIRLVAIVPLLQLWNVSKCIISGCYLRLSSNITIGHNGHNYMLWGHFLSLWGVFSVFDFIVGVVSVLNLYFGECSSGSFSLLLSKWELVQLVLLVALKCNANICIFWCFDALHEHCSNWYDWFHWSYYDIRLMPVICGYLTFY